jgi:hypothetical protein
MTQWDAFCPRPVEVPVVAGAGRGGGGGGRGAGAAASADVGAIRRIWGIIGMNPPGGGGGGGRGGGFGGFGGGATAGTGDYLVTLTVGGQTYKQTFRVEATNNYVPPTP